ncbi:MAG: hypothetical protein NVS9B14_06230 [Candidatus Acidiferrum sp.]
MRLPLVPDAVRLTAPVEAELLALKSTDAFAPGVIENGLVGLAVTPDGNPVRETWTAPEKPFCGVTLTVTAVLVAPCDTVTVVGETEMEKSGEGGGGGGG